MDRRIDGRFDGWMDGWIGRFITFLCFIKLCIRPFWNMDSPSPFLHFDFFMKLLQYRKVILLAFSLALYAEEGGTHESHMRQCPCECIYMYFIEKGVCVCRVGLLSTLTGRVIERCFLTPRASLATQEDHLELHKDICNFIYASPALIIPIKIISALAIISLNYIIDDNLDKIILILIAYCTIFL